jgi:CRISPR-associated protein Csb2
VLDRRSPTPDESACLATLDHALAGFADLRAGPAGRLRLVAAPVDVKLDPLTAPSRLWESLTPYQMTRHPKGMLAADALATDLRAECRRRGLPEPVITVRHVRGVPGVGVIGDAQLSFKTAVNGPIVLGRSRHLGGGVFVGSRAPDASPRRDRTEG